MKNLLLLVAFLLFTAAECSKKKYRFPADATIEMSKTGCYGRCPIYDIKIDGKGNVFFSGKRFVNKEGERKKQLSAEATNNLFKAFIDSNFWNFEDEYTENVSDLPTTYLSLSNGGKSKKVTDYYGAPDALKRLEKLVENVANSDGWVRGGVNQ